jgi:hypothetical protein
MRNFPFPWISGAESPSAPLTAPPLRIIIIRRRDRMRIWDLPPERLCRQHLLGEHRELHALWAVLHKKSGSSGYQNHPETLRWKGKLKALFLRHEALVSEMGRRGYSHRSPLPRDQATGRDSQDVFLQSPREQLILLKKKGCSCQTDAKPGVKTV